MPEIQAHESLYDHAVCKLLDRVSVTRTSFEEMTGTTHPWEIMNGSLNHVQNQFLQIENDLSANHKDGSLTCVKTAEGAFWLNKSGVDTLMDELNHTIVNVTQKGPSPLWSYTSIELFTQNLENLKRLIIATSHDRVEIKRLQTLLNGNGDNILAELNKANAAMDELLTKVKNHAPHVSIASLPDVVLFERAKITFDLLQKHVKTEQQLGYDRVTLKRVYDMLEARCGSRVKNFRQRIQSFMLMFREELRQSEILQLMLSGRWGICLATLDSSPDSLNGLTRVVRKEIDWFTTFVSSREQEQGPTPTGVNAVAMAEKATDYFENGQPSEEDLAGQALTDEEIQNLLASDQPKDKKEIELAESKNTEKKPKKNSHRMAFTSRGGRR
ncbi:MAG: hypothetical protein P9L94_09685 [Candidatus Hinthialibacter antarcticus]|nr:hypothetical protein [Candidatus Hinthialibacter antarcticus]